MSSGRQAVNIISYLSSYLNHVNLPQISATNLAAFSSTIEAQPRWPFSSKRTPNVGVTCGANWAHSTDLSRPADNLPQSDFSSTTRAGKTWVFLRKVRFLNFFRFLGFSIVAYFLIGSHTGHINIRL